MKTIIPFIVTVLFAHLSVLGDGTKQLKKTSSETSCIQLHGTDGTTGGVPRKSATYLADSNQRICFTINDFTNEVVLFGFQLNDYSPAVYFRIRDTSSTPLMGPTLLANSGTGYISSYARAVAGPNHATYIPNASGYNPFVFVPTHN